MGLPLAEIENPLNNFCSSYEELAREIREGIEEGFKEGLNEGIKLGFINGIKECRDKGFENIEVPGMEEALKSALDAKSEEAVYATIKQAVSSEYWTKISPVFKQEMVETCNRTLKEMKEVNSEQDKKSLSGIAGSINGSLEKIKGFIAEVTNGVKKDLPLFKVFESFFDCLQNEFDRDLEKNLKMCKERIFEITDSKLVDERLGYERH